MWNTIKSFLGLLPSSSSLSPEEMRAVKTFVDQVIRDNTVAVFSKSYCPYCTRAKHTLQSLGIKDRMTVVELDQRNDGQAIQDYLAELQSASRVTVPRIYIKQKLVGGNDDLQALKSSDKLEDMVKG